MKLLKYFENLFLFNKITNLTSLKKASPSIIAYINTMDKEKEYILHEVLNEKLSKRLLDWDVSREFISWWNAATKERIQLIANAKINFKNK